jgi:hypothetical protein
MYLKVLGLACLTSSAVGISACGDSDETYPPPVVVLDGGTGGTGGTGGMAMPPAMGQGSVRLIPGITELVGSGVSSCTNQVPATGDRWCGFAALSFDGFIDLWVLNMTEALRGQSIKCDQSDLRCLRLTRLLFVDPDFTFRVHGFDGDTLIYQAESRSADPLAPFVGPVSAWRPGWTEGRKLTSNTGIGCAGHAKSDSVYCFENLDSTTTAGQTKVDVLAGKLSATTATTALLPKVETVLVGAMTDPGGVSKFQVELTPNGDYLAWSSRATPTDAEVLKVQRVGDDASRRVVAEDVNSWSISSDSLRWYWLKAFNHNVMGSPAGALEMATFPEGTAPTPLLAGVADFAVAGDKGLLLRTNVMRNKGDLSLIQDRDSAATTTRMIDSGVLTILNFSKDGKTAMYVKNEAVDGLVDLFVRNVDAAAPCTLSSMTLAAPLGGLLDSGGFAVWAKLDERTDEFHGFQTSVMTCASNQFASNVVRWTAIKDEGFVYEDDSSADGLEGSLRYAHLVGGAWPAMTNLVQTRAGTVYGLLLPALPAVVYTVNVNSAMVDGVYVNGTLPYMSSNPDAGVAPPTDAGTGGGGADGGVDGGG